MKVYNKKEARRRKEDLIDSEDREWGIEEVFQGGDRLVVGNIEVEPLEVLPCHLIVLWLQTINETSNERESSPKLHTRKKTQKAAPPPGLSSHTMQLWPKELTGSTWSFEHVPGSPK